MRARAFLAVALSLVAFVATRAAAGERITFPYKPTYFMFTTTDQLPDSSNQIGMRFQTSFAVTLPQGPLSELPGIRAGELRMAYTITTSLDAFAESSPIWNTDQSPEVFWQYRDPGGLLREVKAGWLHLSNGESGDASRSVDRFATQLGFSLDRWVGGLQFWVRPWYTMDTGENTDGWHEIVNFDVGGNENFGADAAASFSGERGSLTVLGGKDWISGLMALPIAEGSWSLLIRGHSGIMDTILDYAERDKAIGVGIQVNQAPGM